MSIHMQWLLYMKGRLPPTDGLQYNYCIDLRAFIKSFELTVAIINLRTGAHLLISQFFATKRTDYINASHQVHIFASEEQVFVNREPSMLFIFSVML